MSGHVYRVSGTVEAPDGTTYEPIYWGDLDSVRTVFEAIRVGAWERDEGYSLVIDSGPGTVRVRSAERPVSATAPGSFVVLTIGADQIRAASEEVSA